MKRIFICLTIIILFMSCDKCHNDDCPPNAKFQYKLIDSNGDNLFMVINNCYNADSIQIIGYRESREIFIGGLTSDNIVFFEIMKDIDSVIVNYNSIIKDTFVYQNIISKNDDCCGDIVSNFDVKLNGKNFCSECVDSIWNIEK